jgi:hypothetical protein
MPTGCGAPDHKHNDGELPFACFSVLRPEIQTIPLTERYGHCSALGSTRNDWGTSCPCLLPPMAVKSKPPVLRVVVDSAPYYFFILFSTLYNMAIPVFRWHDRQPKGDRTRVAFSRFILEVEIEITVPQRPLIVKPRKAAIYED